MELDEPGGSASLVVGAAVEDGHDEQMCETTLEDKLKADDIDKTAREARSEDGTPLEAEQGASSEGGTP